MAIDGKHLGITYNHGVLQWRCGDLTDEAVIDKLKDLCVPGPAGQEARLLLATVHMERGDFSSAVRLLKEHLAADAGNKEAQSLLAVAATHQDSVFQEIRTFGEEGGVLGGTRLSEDRLWQIDQRDAQTLRITDATTNREIALLHGHQPRLSRPQCTSSDGRWVVTGRARESGIELPQIELVDTRENTASMFRCGGAIDCVCLFRNGKYAVSGSFDRKVVLWNVETGESVRSHSWHADGITCVSTSDDGRIGICAGNDRRVHVWNLDTGRCLATMVGHPDDIKSVWLSSDGTLAVTGSRGGKYRVWRLPTKWHSFCTSFVSRVRSDVEIAGVEDRLLELWYAVEDALAKGDVKGALSHASAAKALPGYERSPETLQMFQEIARRCVRGELKSAWVVHTLKEHGDCLFSVGMTTDGRWALSADGTVRNWNLSERKLSATLQTKSVCFKVAIGRGHHLALTADMEARISIWDIPAARIHATLPGDRNHVRCLALSPDTQWIAYAGGSVSNVGKKDAITGDYNIRIAQVSTGRLVRLLKGHTHEVNSLQWSSDGTTVLSASRDGTIRSWNVSKGICKGNLANTSFGRHAPAVQCADLSGDGSRAVAAMDDHSLLVWDVMRGCCEQKLTGHESWIYSVCLSHDGRWALSGSADNTMRLWDLANRECVYVFKGHTSTVYSVAMSGDLQWALSGSTDHTVRLWWLDWDLSLCSSSASESSLDCHLRNFLWSRTPYAGQLPEGPASEEQIVNALSRRGIPQWNDDEFKRLMVSLNTFGLGGFDASIVRRKLDAMMPNLGAPPSTSSAFSSAGRLENDRGSRSEPSPATQRTDRLKRDPKALAISLSVSDWKDILAILDRFSSEWSREGKQLEPNLRELTGAFHLLMERQLEKGFGEVREIEFKKEDWRKVMLVLNPPMSLLDDQQKEKLAIARLLVGIHEGLN